LPGTNSFVSEFLVLIGTFKRYPAWGVLATVGIIFAAVYMLWIFQRTMTGRVRGAAVLGPDSAGGGEPGNENRNGEGPSGEAPAGAAPAGAVPAGAVTGGDVPAAGDAQASRVAV